MAQKVTMEDAIGLLVDTITDVLLVFEEAAADTKKKVHVGAVDQVQKAVHVLAEQARRIASYIDKEYKPRMDQLVVDIERDQGVIAAFQGVNLESEQSERIHATLKNILDHSVKMLALNDLHQVRQATNMGKLVAEMLARMSKVGDVDSLMSVGQEAIPLLANLKEVFARRLRVIAHPERMAIMQRVMGILDTHSILIIETSRDYILNPNVQNERLRTDAFTKIIKAIFDGMDVIEASSQFLQSFDIEFFFPGGGGYRKAIDPAIAARLRALAGEIGKALGDLGIALKSGDHAAVIAAAQRVIAGMKEAMALARALAEQMDDPIKKAALLEAASTLEWIAPELLRITKALLDDPHNPELLRRHQELMDKANQATAMIKLAATIGALEPLFAEMFQAIAKGDEKAALAAADKIIANLDEQIRTGRQIAEHTTNPNQRARILEAIKTLEEEKVKLKPAVTKVVRNPKDQDAKDALQAIVNNIASASTDLADAAIVPLNYVELPLSSDLPMEASAAEREAVDLAHAIHDALDRLVDAVKKGDAKLASAAMREFIDKAREQIKLAREIAKDVVDPKIKKELLDAAGALETLIPQLEFAVTDALAHPGDIEKQHRVQALAQRCKDESAKISAAVVKAANERIAGVRLPQKANAHERTAVDAAYGVFQALDDLWDAVLRGDARLVNLNIEKFKAKAKEQIEAARAMAKDCKDPVLKQKLNAAADKLEKLVPRVEEAARFALAHPNDAEARQRLADLMAESKAASSEIAQLAVDAANARLKWEEEERMRHAAAAERARMEAERKRQEEEEARRKAALMKIDERVPAHVAKAIRGMDDAANKSRFGENTPQGQLIKASRTVADLLQEFTLAAENLDKAGMIAAARKICEAIKGVKQLAAEVGKTCTNDKLTQSLLNIAQAPENYGTQLKLIASVKTQTHDDIRSAKGQMYAAAKHIADTLTETIKAGEACALRSGNTSAVGKLHDINNNAARSYRG